MLIDIHAFYRPFMRRFRSRRMQFFASRFRVSNDVRILDLGGTSFNWQFIDSKPKITCVNLVPLHGDEPNFVYHVGDGRRLAYSDNSFDIAFSNSVIEHVGDWADQQAFAREMRRVAPRYYVQTPNRKFFFEPHYLTPFIHFLPLGLQHRLARNFTVWGWLTRPSREAARAFVVERRLLTHREMQELFPDAEIVTERFLGMVKSIIAIKS